MKISARNVFEGKISAITSGPVSAEVEVTTTGGDKLVGTITQGSVASLGLSVGKDVVALVKASNVLVMTDGSGVQLSARNCLPGKVSKLIPGPVSAEVVISLPGGAQIFASITRDATDELGIKEGVAATAVIKASSVIIGVKA
ncbi:MAG: transporter [Proteobacteria bacterium]|nr:transporter [Pseudomonadota bacterium]